MSRFRGGLTVPVLLGLVAALFVLVSLRQLEEAWRGDASVHSQRQSYDQSLEYLGQKALDQAQEVLFERLSKEDGALLSALRTELSTEPLALASIPLGGISTETEAGEVFLRSEAVPLERIDLERLSPRDPGHRAQLRTTVTLANSQGPLRRFVRSYPYRLVRTALPAQLSHDGLSGWDLCNWAQELGSSCGDLEEAWREAEATFLELQDLRRRVGDERDQVEAFREQWMESQRHHFGGAPPATDTFEEAFEEFSFRPRGYRPPSPQELRGTLSDPGGKLRGETLVRDLKWAQALLALRPARKKELEASFRDYLERRSEALSPPREDFEGDAVLLEHAGALRGFRQALENLHPRIRALEELELDLARTLEGLRRRFSGPPSKRSPDPDQLGLRDFERQAREVFRGPGASLSCRRLLGTASGPFAKRLDGILVVENPPEEPLWIKDRTLAGDLLLILKGPARLENFGPRNLSRHRISVLALGPLELAGRVEAEIAAFSTLRLEPEAVLSGALHLFPGATPSGIRGTIAKPPAEALRERARFRVLLEEPGARGAELGG